MRTVLTTDDATMNMMQLKYVPNGTSGVRGGSGGGAAATGRPGDRLRPEIVYTVMEPAESAHLV